MHSAEIHPPAANEGSPAAIRVAPAGLLDSSGSSPPGRTDSPNPGVEQTITSPGVPQPRRWRKWVVVAVVVAALAGALSGLIPWVNTELNTISTDDAYVNGDATYVAPRVSGQVSRVLVSGNQRVKKGDLLLQLDKEPYQVQVQIKAAAVVAAETDLAAAKSQVRGLLAQAGA